MDVLEKPVYHIEDKEIDAVRGCLRCGEQEHYLRQQTFDVLLYLLENRQRLISKDELIEAIWQGTAVTDNALVQCIVEIRKALGDDSRQPRFIKTVPKLGYRFIGTVQERRLSDAPIPESNGARVPSGRHDTELLDEAVATQPLPIEGVPGTSGKIGIYRKPTLYSALAFVIVVAVTTAGLVVSHKKASAPHATDVTLAQLPGRKALAIMYFDNQSTPARADLDWLREGLADMFITDMARSDKLTVLSREQLHSLLERTGHKPGEKVQFDEALDIARRSHAESFVLGTFTAVDQRIRIDVQLYDSSQGQLKAADHQLVDNPREILSQIDNLALRLSSRLDASGDTKANLAEAMTDNLEAYRYYSLGVEKAQAFQNAQAIKLLQKAIDLDPKFAMAYARIGYVYAVADFLPDKSLPYLEKAFQMSSRLTEKDRLYITAWYAIAQGDYPGAVKTFGQIIAEYPLEVEAYSRLGRLLMGEEQPQKALEVLKQGLAVDPEAKDLYNSLGVALFTMGKKDEAIAAHQRYVELAPKEPNSHDSLGMSYQRFGLYSEAMAEYKTALSIDPEFEPSIVHVADLDVQEGRYHDAIRGYQKYIEVTQGDRARSIGYGNIALIYLRMGDLHQAEEAAAKETKYEKSAVWSEIVIALQQKNAAKVDMLKRVLFGNLPNTDRGIRSNLRGMDYHRGYLEAEAGNSTDAMAHFKEALQHLPPSSAMDIYEDCLANAYLESHQVDAAIAEYQRILQLNPNYPLVYYHLAQAYELKGQQQQELAAYKSFLQVWDKADADLPEVITARKVVGNDGTTAAVFSQGSETAITRR